MAVIETGNRVALMLLRKSRKRREREEEARDPDILRTHRTILLELAAGDGITIAPERICAELKSGKRIDRRPEFQRFLSHLHSLPDGGDGLLYVMDADRITRGDMEERALVEGLLRRKGIRLRTPAGIVDLSNTDQRLLHQVKGALAEWELGKYQERVDRTRALMVREGRLRGGRLPYGYEWDHRTKGPKPHPERFPILVACCREVWHMGTERLARKHHLQQQVLYRALTSPIICGWPARVRDADGNRLPRALWVWPDRPGDYPAAVTREEWERLQTLLRSRREGRQKTVGAEGWCRDVVRFPAYPGGRAQLSSVVWEGERVPVYDWVRYEGGRRRHLGVVARAQVHTVALAGMAAAFSDPDRFLRDLTERRARMDAGRPAAAALSAEAERLRGELVNLERVLAQPSITQERYEAVSGAREAVEAELRAVRHALQETGRAGHESGIDEELLRSMASVPFEGVWAEMDEGLRRLSARSFYAEIQVTVLPAPASNARGERRVVLVSRFGKEHD